MDGKSDKIPIHPKIKRKIARKIKRETVKLTLRQSDFFYVNVLFNRNKATIFADNMLQLTENEHTVLLFLPENERAKCWLLLGFKNKVGHVFFTLPSTISAGQFNRLRQAFSKTIERENAERLGFRLSKFLKEGIFLQLDLKNQKQRWRKFEQQT